MAKDYEWITKWPPVGEIIDPDSYGEVEMPVLKEKILPTMDKKVIIECAVTGWQPTRWWRERGEKTLPPGSIPGETCIQDQVDAILEAVNAGAACIHMHPRHPSDGIPRLHDVDLMATICDRAFEEQDFITMSHSFTWDFRKSIVAEFEKGTGEYLDRGKGNRYIQGSLIPSLATYTEDHPVFTDEAVAEGCRFFEANDVKPILSVEPFYFSQMKRELIDSGALQKKPYLIALQFGKHRDDMQFADPWAQLNTINCMGMVRAVIPEKDMCLGLHPGGRNWLATSVCALVNGAQYIRLGVEDIFFLWPHKNDISRNVSQTVEMIVDLCKILGRKVATVDEAREIMGIVRTS